MSNNSASISSNVRADLDQEKLVITIYPQVGEGLSGFGSGYAMSTHGKVVKGGRLSFTKLPTSKSIRQFAIEPRRHLIIPSSNKLGKTGFRIQ